ncbi:MAG: hypothetical protein O3C20_23365 [Verrucomicrobia bacterium]|nr:hypothetical protein [Verrucomicrobiota bacterium]
MKYAFLPILFAFLASTTGQAAERNQLTLEWKENILTIHGDHLPGNELTVWYLEAYCRDNSQTTHWGQHTVVGHTTQLVSRSEDGTQIKLRCEVNDGVIVDHTITAKHDEVDIQIIAHNPTNKRSVTHWAQPCVRVGEFTGTGPGQTDDKYAYLGKSFVFLDNKLARMPTRDWAIEARYKPGQVWAGPNVPRSDVNPRPLHPDVPSNGLIGCFNADETMIFAMAFEPYQELFQGVIRCLHSDFRLGGLEAGQTLEIKGKFYFVENDMPTLLKRYHTDFPEHISFIAPLGK